ncbi:MAG: rod shape-determining protein RodA [Bacteriovoracaceae bacterium]
MNRSDIIEFFKKYDFSFFGISGGIFLIGILNLYSATHATPESNIYMAQLMWFLFSLLVGFFISLMQPKNFFRYAYFFYIVCIVLLVLVLFVGQKGMGAQRWIMIGPFRLQPSELTKVGVVLGLGRWFSLHDPDREMGLRDIIMPFIIAFIPTLLIVVEPDLGTGLLVLLIFLVMAFYRRLNVKTIGIIAIVGIISGGLMYQFGLKDYQRKRVMTFIDPSADAKGSGYNAIQSKIAIGSGQFFGKGFKKSTQASLNYLPENHTDFAFSIFNEEHGFIGALFLISLYMILFWRYLWLAQSVTKVFDSIIAVGLMSIFFWHTFVNMGMVMGLMPVVGLPLPFVSYGGSALLTFGICNGIATSISNSRNLF